MTATLTLRINTGTNAGTESGAQTGFAFMDIDSAANTPANDVTPGTNSFEKWFRLRVDVAPLTGVTGFWVRRDGILPDGVVIKLGVTDTGATPTALESTVAVETMHAGRPYFYDASALTDAGDHTRFLVVQAQVAGSATSGAIPQQDWDWGWSES